MKRTEHLLHSLIVGAFMCTVTTGVSAHDPKKKTNLALLGVGERLQIAFLAKCNGPQDEYDDFVVPPHQRKISFDLVVEGRETNTGKLTRFINPINLNDGGSTTLDLFADELGNLLEVTVENVTGQGVCRVSSTGRLIGPSGETRAHTTIFDTTEVWIIPVVNPDGYN